MKKKIIPCLLIAALVLVCLISRVCAMDTVLFADKVKTSVTIERLSDFVEVSVTAPDAILALSDDLGKIICIRRRDGIEASDSDLPPQYRIVNNATQKTIFVLSPTAFHDGGYRYDALFGELPFAALDESIRPE